MEKKNDELIEKLEEYDTLEKIQAKIVQVEEEIRLLGDQKESTEMFKLKEELAAL